MTTEEIVKMVWEYTRTGNTLKDMRYSACLNRTLRQPRIIWHLQPFLVRKKSGSSRVIVPADEDLRYIQSILTSWLLRKFPHSFDYCYTGRSIKKALLPHLGSTCALVVDLKNAFEHVSADMVRFALRRYQPGLPMIVVNCVTELLTFEKSTGKKITPQGCVSTPYIYNLVMWQVDQMLELLKKKYKGLYISRYSDNILLSSDHNIDLGRLQKDVTSIAVGNGFELSWVKVFEEPPFEYIGALIFPGRLSIDYDKCDFYEYILEEAIQSTVPNSYRAQITGIFSWVYSVSGKDFPPPLLKLMGKYFSIVKRQPKKLLDLRAREKSDQLPF